MEMPAQQAVGQQHALLIQRPDLTAVVGAQQFGRKAAEEMAQIGHVALQHRRRMVVAGGVHRLRQVDDHRAVGADQDVELRQVTVHHPRAQHAHHLADQGGMVGARQLRREAQVVQARRGVAVGVAHQFHQQHALVEVVGLGHPHAGRGQAVERIHLGALPGRLHGLPAELGAFGHGAGLAAVLGLAVLGVVHRLAEAAVGGGLVDLGAAGFFAAAHHEDHRLLAAHQLALHRVDQAFVEQRPQPFGGFHGGDCCAGAGPVGHCRAVSRAREESLRIGRYHRP